MEGHGGEDILSAAMAAISLVTDNMSNTELVARLTEMQRTIHSLQTEREALVEEKNHLQEELAKLTEDNSAMEDRIAELEERVSPLGDTPMKTGKKASLLPDDPPGDNPDEPQNEGRDLLPIPYWRVKYICDRISTGERPTFCNMTYINIYCNDNRYIGAKNFRDKIVDAHKKMCQRFPGKVGVPQEVINDFESVNDNLVHLATLNQRDYIVRMFRALRENNW